MTFEGNTLPDYIKIFGLRKVKVHLYVERIKTCQNCFRYGHNTKTCRSPKKCGICNQPALEDHSCTLEETVKCLHCSKQHRTFSRECETYQLNQQISETMAPQSIGFWEAKNIINNSTLGNNRLISTDLFSQKVLTKSNFPPLKQPSMKQEYILKTIGGQQRPDPSRKVLVSAGECSADSFK